MSDLQSVDVTVGVMNHRILPPSNIVAKIETSDTCRCQILGVSGFRLISVHFFIVEYFGHSYLSKRSKDAKNGFFIKF